MSSAPEKVNDENAQIAEIEAVEMVKKKPLNFRTEILKVVHSPSDVLSPFSQKISSERNSALKNFKPKSLMDRLLGTEKKNPAESVVAEVQAQPKSTLSSTIESESEEAEADESEGSEKEQKN